MIHGAKEATLETLNSLVWLREYDFHIFLQAALQLQGKLIESQWDFNVWAVLFFLNAVCITFLHLHRYGETCFGVLFKFSALLQNRILLRNQSGKELGDADKTSFLHCRSRMQRGWSCQAAMTAEITLAHQPLDRKKTKRKNLDFIENQKPADGVLSALTQETLRWSCQILTILWKRFRT